MTSTSARSVGSLSTNIVHRGETGTGPFMLTLCRLVEPVSIRPPQSPHLKPFTFFTSHARQGDGSEEVYLHMGFFETVGSAEKWVRAVRTRHPDAIATVSPPAFWQLPSDVPEWQSFDSLRGSADSRRFAPVGNDSLTDTQVLNILEARHPDPALIERDQQDSEHIELLRPDDTGTRRALKEAVAQGMPVSFALQLHWSARAIDLSRIPSLPLFKAHSLYAVESRSSGRSRFFLRLGFFGDPLSAKQAASHLRATFASAAVVPVLDEEIARAREACAQTSVIPCLVQQRLDHASESSTAPGSATGSKSEGGRRRGAPEGRETLEQTLTQLAERELWNDPDFLSDTGVRHIKVEMV